MPIPFIIGGLVLLTGAAMLDSADQRDKRRKDQKRYSHEIDQLKTSIEMLKEQHALLVVQLGKKNEQVRVLCRTIQEYQAELKRKTCA